jgi:hypothetical protein
MTVRNEEAAVSTPAVGWQAVSGATPHYAGAGLRGWS